MRKYLIYILAASAFGLLIYLVVSQDPAPRKYRWTESYSWRVKEPYGCFVTYARIVDLFPEKEVSVFANNTIYEIEGYSDDEIEAMAVTDPFGDDHFYDEVEEDDTELVSPEDETEIKLEDKNNHNYFFISRYQHFDEKDSRTLLYHAHLGNHIFIAANSFTGQLRRKFKLEVSKKYEEEFDSLRLNFSNPKIKRAEPYSYLKGSVNQYFNEFDEETAEILVTNDHADPTMIRFKVGKGSIIFSCTPKAFTNVNMLYFRNKEFIEKAVSYLPENDLVWADNYNKRNYDTGRRNRRDWDEREASKSKMDFINENPPLAWGFWILIVAGTLFAIWGVKRRQRLIPVRTPPQNTTLQFVGIISDLYFQKGDHRDLALKKINYFLEYIRTQFYIKSLQWDENMYFRISERSGVSQDKVQEMFERIQWVQEQKTLSQGQLLGLSNMLDEFKKKSKV